MISTYVRSLALTLAFTAALPALASAQAVCGARAQIVSTLGEKYLESRHGLGLVGKDGQGMMELFVSKRGSWTMLMTMAQGTTCIIAAGQQWEASSQNIAGAGI